MKKNKSFRPQHTQTPPINATSTDNRKLQCDHPNGKYLYLRQYDRHHYNSDGKPSIRASSQKVSTGYHQQQPEIATWLPKPEIVISLELQLIAGGLKMRDRKMEDEKMEDRKSQDQVLARKMQE